MRQPMLQEGHQTDGELTVAVAEFLLQIEHLTGELIVLHLVRVDRRILVLAHEQLFVRKCSLVYSTRRAKDRSRTVLPLPCIIAR
jgi:hypothetical protein